MKTPYSPNYTPPAPILWLHIAVPLSPPLTDPYPALLDTGADGTFVPTYILERLSTPSLYMTNVRSHLGETLRRVAVHRVDLVFDALRLPNVEVVSDDWSAEIIVGRNVLSKLFLHLNGPKQLTELK